MAQPLGQLAPAHPLRQAALGPASRWMPLTVTIDETLDAATWSDLALRVRPEVRFLAYGWWQAWADAMLPYDSWRGSFRLLVVRDARGVVQAVLPLAAQMMAGISVLSLAGSYEPFRSPLIAATMPSETVEALVRFLTDEFQPKALRFGPVQADAPEIQSLKAALTAAGWRFCLMNRGDSHLIDLPADPAAYQGTVSKKQRQAIAYQRRRLAREGGVRILRHRGLKPSAWEPVIDQLGKIERASWLASKGGDLTYAAPKSAAFWRRYLSHEAASRALSVWVMSIDDKPVSFNVALDSDGYRYGLFSHYDEALKSYSPGHIVGMDTITSCFDDDIRHFNLGRGDSGSKARFGVNRTQPLEDWMAMPPTAAGRAFHLAARVRFRISNTQSGTVNDA